MINSLEKRIVRLISARGFAWGFLQDGPFPLLENRAFSDAASLSLAVFVWEFELLPRSNSSLFKVS